MLWLEKEVILRHLRDKQEEHYLVMVVGEEIKKLGNFMNNIKKGLGGWMILLTMFLLLNFFIWFEASVKYALILTNIKYTIFFLVSSAITISFLYVLILEFKKKRKFVHFSIIVYWISLFLSIFINLINMNEDYLPLGAVIIGVIMNIYLKQSKRVENTFVN